jgi:hypothetical protein
MTIFEYLSIAASILLALALGRLASAIPYVFSRRRFDLVYALIYVALFFGALLQWWLIWGISEYNNWSYLSFVLLMASPLVLFVLAHVLVSERPSEVDSWSHYLSENHRLFFFLLFIGFVIARARDFIFQGIIPDWWALSFSSLFVAGAIWNNRILFSILGFFMLLRIIAFGWGGVGNGT